MAYQEGGNRQYSVLVDLDRCVECHACEVACKLENNLKPEEEWIHVVAIGPKSVSGKLCAEYFPLMTEKCTLCEHRFVRGLEPFCVSVCPTKALKFCSPEEALSLLKGGKRYIVSKVKDI